MNLRAELATLVQEVEVASAEDGAFAIYGPGIIDILREMIARPDRTLQERRELSYAMFRTVTDDRDVGESPLGRRIRALNDAYERNGLDRRP